MEAPKLAWASTLSFPQSEYSAVARQASLKARDLTWRRKPVAWRWIQVFCQTCQDNFEAYDVARRHDEKN